VARREKTAKRDQSSTKKIGFRSCEARPLKKKKQNSPKGPETCKKSKGRGKVKHRAAKKKIRKKVREPGKGRENEERRLVI